MMFTVCCHSLFPSQQEKGEEASGLSPASAPPLNQAPPPSRSAHRWHVIARHWLRQTRRRTSGVLPVTTRITRIDREPAIRSMFTCSLPSFFIHGNTGFNRSCCPLNPLVLWNNHTARITCLAARCQRVRRSKGRGAPSYRSETAPRKEHISSATAVQEFYRSDIRVKCVNPNTNIMVPQWHARKFFSSSVGKSTLLICSPSSTQ